MFQWSAAHSETSARREPLELSAFIRREHLQMVKRTRVGLLILAWWQAQPFSEAQFYLRELRRGAYPTDADSISIPIMSFVFGWLLLSPLTIWVVWWILRRGPDRFTWLAFDSSRPVWCALWTAALARCSWSKPLSHW